METATGKEGLEVAPTLYFDHRMTNRIKGIAIIMMMILLFPLEELGIVSMEI